VLLISHSGLETIGLTREHMPERGVTYDSCASVYSFIALMLLAGQQEGHLTCTKSFIRPQRFSFLGLLGIGSKLV